MGRLFWKIFAVIWLALLGAGWLAGWVVWLRFAADGKPPALEATPHSAFMMDAASAVLASEGTAGLAAWIDKVRPSHPEIRSLHAIDAQGHAIGDTLPSPEATAQARKQTAMDSDSPPGFAPARTALDSAGHAWVLFVSEDHHGPPRPDGLHLPGGDPHGPPDGPGRAWPLLAAGLIVSVVCSGGLATYLTRPVRELRKGFAELAAGHLDIRIGQSVGRRRDEIADLVRDFDRMALRLDSLVAAQTRLLHDVSHELRSPLARMQISIDLALQNPARTEASLDRIEREIGRLNLLVGDILDFARLEAANDRHARDSVDMTALLADIVADADFEARAAGKHVVLEAAIPLVLTGHRGMMARAIENVVRNAVKFTAPGTTVKVALAEEAGEARLAVRDHGPGVPDDMLLRIFEPFACTGQQRDSEGTGLGLAIVARAMQLDAGRYEAANRAEGGLEVLLAWPARPMDAA